MRGVRVFLLVFGACALLAALAAPYVWQRLKDLRGPLEEGAKRNLEEAIAFAAEHEQSECAPEALRRIDACDGIWCEVGTPQFTKECLSRARPSPALCDGIPKSFVKAALWPASECLERPVEPQLCRRVLLEVLTFCTTKREPASREPAGTARAPPG
jgi:hypothetical protein